jgi:organic hydroperoxide reductase OsmC/OhrA
MHPLPHHYAVSVQAPSAGAVTLRSPGVPDLESAAPAEFGGPGDRWSPETLLTAAVADCFVLSFRAVAAASKFPWTALGCDVTGTLERREGRNLFTRFETRARLRIPSGGDAERARRLLEKAEQVCLITNSLSAERHLEVEVLVGDA